MLYKHNGKTLSKELFKNPTSEYRGAPFWSWNCELNKELLCRQIEYLKEMGFGGFHMHSRPGMATKYLSDDFFDLISACVHKAKDEGMLAYLYDEDRYSSGTAGGFVSMDNKLRQRYLLFTPNKKENTVSVDEAYLNAEPAYLASYKIELDEDGYIKSYERTDEGENLWYAYFMTDPKGGWFNNQSYSDLLSKKTTERFIELTHEKFKEKVGDEFGKTIPSIFTDEPYFKKFTNFEFAESKTDNLIPWAYKLEEDFKEKCGFDILDFLPEMFWELGKDKVSRARYLFYDYINERFTAAYSDVCGKWCEDNGIYFTGHFMGEGTLDLQTRWMGDAMRCLRSYGIPGMDLLENNIELATAKQVQSVVHQYNREAMLSELYGVTNWAFDFRGHKFQGDWQAALGVTVRVHHLSWVSMKGSAKRDYPASINYQSPWYKKYSYIEDHYARLNTVLTRGKPEVNIAVIHPVESYWINNGPNRSTTDKREELETNFANVISWLLYGQLDFDFISEALLPAQVGEIKGDLSVGAMKYSVVIVPALETIRKTTVDILNKFIDNGGKVIFMGSAPKFVDAVKSDDAKSLFEKAECINFSKAELFDVLSPYRRLEILKPDGNRCDNLIYNLRKDTDCEWLFIANGKYVENPDRILPKTVIIRIFGEYTPVLYDTLSGEIKGIAYEIKNNVTEIGYTLYEYDSLLLQLLPKTKEKNEIKPESKEVIKKSERMERLSYKREEPNVYMLDMAKYRIDSSELMDMEEIIRIDSKVREKLGFIAADGMDVQPWMIEKEIPFHFVTLEFEILSSADVKDTYLAFEEADEITLNGNKVNIDFCGYYVDESIHKIKLGDIVKGKNILKVKVPITNRISLENMFLLGEFDVSLNGMTKVIEEKSDEITFDSITKQGLPFYGGNLIYETEIECPECDLGIEVSLYRGALVSVQLDDKKEENIVFSPYSAVFKDVKAGRHKLKFTLYGNRHNTFGPLHNCTKADWGWTMMWYTKGADWSYEYNVLPTGILKSPVITFYKKD